MRPRTVVGANLVIGLVCATVLSGLGASAYLPGNAWGTSPAEGPPAVGQVFGENAIVAPATFTSPNAQTYGSFGAAVAISGNKLVVGAYFESASGQTYAGHAYVISLKTGLVIELTSPHPQDAGLFGITVAISGKTVVVGAYGENVSGLSDAGHAYVFNLRTGSVIELASPNSEVHGLFGSSVAISGKRIVVGASGENVSGHYGAGRAYTFVAGTGALISTLSSPNPENNSAFGASVAISGKHVVVGAPYETASGQANGGHAYTFLATTGAAVSTLTSPNPESFGVFGFSVAASGKRVVVGAYGETVLAHGTAGRAYTFLASTGALLSTLSSPNPENGSSFGHSVAISGKRIVVGAHVETVLASTAAGHAYTFLASTGALIETVASPHPQSLGFFGYSVAISGTQVLIGAYEEQSWGQTEAGNAYLFST